MSECLKMFIFIIHQLSNIWRYEPSYCWKYVFILFEICLYIIWKNSPRTSKIWWLVLQVSSQIRHTIVGYPTTYPPSIVANLTRLFHIWRHSVTKCHRKTYSRDVENSLMLEEIGRYNTFHHCKSTKTYFTLDVVRLCRRILGSNPIVIHH